MSHLRGEPVLLAPNFNKDTSDIGAGGVLLQEDDNGVDHPVCYFSKKFSKCQKNTVEKEKMFVSQLLFSILKFI